VTVESLSPAAAGLAFVAGLLSFLSPCVLPLLPVYLSYLSGVGVERLEAERWQVLRVALAFVAGFTLVFVLMGAGAGGIGSLLLHHRRALAIVAGAFLILSGVTLTGLVHLPLPALAPAWGRRLREVPGAAATGAAVAVAWTPCVGPVLGAILSLAASEDAAAGALLLLIYSLGLGVPFIAAALAFGWVGRRLTAVKRHYRAFQVVAGGLLVAAGVLFVTGAFERFARSLSGFGHLGL
jgi:cytochrome c-type biogenesis protein